mgnify:CR=1 FL=1
MAKEAKKYVGFRIGNSVYNECENEALASGVNVSEYLRKVIEQRKDKKVQVVNEFDKIDVTIATHDLEDLIVDARELIVKINRICNTAIKTGEVYQQDIDRVQATLDELVQLMNDTRITAFEDRKKVRSEARAILKSKGVIQ